LPPPPLFTLIDEHSCWLFVLQGKDAGGDETKFDEFLGNDAGVLGATGVYDEEDREADNVWDDIEDRMDERRKVSRPGGCVGEARLDVVRLDGELDVAVQLPGTLGRRTGNGGRRDASR
jgi:hypothetical protein